MILIIEEDDAWRKGARAALSLAGYRVLAVPTYASALEAVFKVGDAPSCVVLAGASAPSWATKIRRGYPSLPILVSMDTGVASNARLEALNSGADAFIERSAPVAELVHRVGVMIRHSADSRELITVGNLQLDTKTGTLLVDGAPLVLAQSRHSVLEALLRRRGAVVPRGDLLDLAGAQSAGALEALMSRLRRSLKERGASVRIAAACNAGYYIEAKEPDYERQDQALPRSMVAG